MKIDTPEKCALLLQHHLNVGLMQARGTAPTGKWERQPHSKFYSNEGTYSKVISASTQQPDPNSSKNNTSKTQEKMKHIKADAICPYNLAGQLGFLTIAGLTLACTNKKCNNRHATLRKLTRAEVTTATAAITVKRIRDLCETAAEKYFNK